MFIILDQFSQPQCALSCSTDGLLEPVGYDFLHNRHARLGETPISVFGREQ